VIPLLAMSIDDSLPDDVVTLQAMLRSERAARLTAEAEAQARSLLIEKLKLTIKKLRHERFGQSSERGALLAQLELQLADLEENATQAETAAQMAAAEKIVVPSCARRRPARRALPGHLPRERIVYPAPSVCPCCGGGTLRKIGEDVTETLELIPRQWKVIQHVREKFSCRTCEAITQPPAPSHPIARGRAGPKLLAHILFAKYGLHLPLNRQSDVYEREGIDLDVSTLADWVGAATATLMPLVDVIRAHVSPLSASTPTTPRCRSWPRARPASADSGPMCAMIARSPGPIRRPQCSSIRVTVAASIPSSIWQAMLD
jgi:transposase